MKVPLDRTDLEAQLALSRERVRIGYQRLEVAKRHDDEAGIQAALNDLLSAKAAVKEVRTASETQLAVWQERVRIGRRRLETAKNHGGNNKSEAMAALRDINAAKTELEAAENVIRLCKKQAELSQELLPQTAAETAEERIERALSPRPPAPVPDRKRDKRLRDREIRARMKGRQLSDDSKHGRGGRKKVKV